MPLYEYRCKKCGVYELIHAMNQNACECPTCGGHAVKLISAGAFVIDGAMSSSKNPNSPEGLQRAKELRQKHTKDNTLKEWKADNLAKGKRDGRVTYE